MKRAWLVRAGRLGERESLALQDSLAVVGWLELPDLSGQDTRESLMELLQDTYSDASPKRLLNWQAQLWAFLHTISDGDLVVLPASQDHLRSGDRRGDRGLRSITL